MTSSASKNSLAIRNLPPLTRENSDISDFDNSNSKELILRPSLPTAAKDNAQTKIKIVQTFETETVEQPSYKGRNPLETGLSGISASKPKFLENLEIFLRKELKSLGVNDTQPSELRLQAHREVFEYLIEDFKTYKPLLASIKNEYEMMLSGQQEQIRRLEPLKQMVVTVSEQCDQKIIKLRDEEKQAMSDLKKENNRLQKVIDDLKNNQFSLMKQVDTLNRKLEEQYQRFKDEEDARKLLVSDINDLRYQQEDLILQQQQASKADKAEDPVVMRLALKKCRENEKEDTKKYNEMVADYGDVIPRTDFEAIEKAVAALQAKYEGRVNDFDTLKTEHETLLEVHKQVIKQRDEFYQATELLRQTATPRPTWEKCADQVTGGVERWTEISKGKRSEELVDLLLLELMGGGSSGDQSTPEHFDARGRESSIPVYLHADAPVRNRHLSKRDVSLLVKDIWKEKAASDVITKPQTGRRMPMGEYFLTYLKSKFTNPQMVTEWAYNVHDACQRYAQDERINLFFGVLTEMVDEEVYFGQLQTIARLLGHFTKIAEGKENADVLPKVEFRAALAGYFTHKIDLDLDSLVAAAEKELEAAGQDNIEYTNLFLEDDEGKFGPFVDELKRQMDAESAQYVSEILHNFSDSSSITPVELQKAIALVDPDIEAPRLDAILIWGFRAKQKSDLLTLQPVGKMDLQARLSKGALKKSHKK